MHDHVIRQLAGIVEADTAPNDTTIVRLMDDLTGVEVIDALRAMLPLARERHRRVGLSAETSEATLVDIERKHRLYGADTVVAWLIGVLRGDVVQVGRLQVEVHSGARGHALHVPETGPLLPEEVSDALDRARVLTRSERFTCTSWLLDSQLTAALPETNIASFARRFDIVDDGEDGGDAVAKFVFRQTPAQLLAEAAPSRTRLERFVLDRLQSGPRWTQPVGTLRIDQQ